MATKLITAPAEEPITLTEVKSQGIISIDDDDSLISNIYIPAARTYAENKLGRALITQTLEYVTDKWPCGDAIYLPRPPLQSVTSVKYYGTDGTEYEWDSSYYIVDADSEPGRIGLAYSEVWPSTTLQPINGIRIRFVAGYGLASAVPVNIKQAILLLVTLQYEHRQPIIVGKAVNPIINTASADALLGQIPAFWGEHWND